MTGTTGIGYSTAKMILILAQKLLLQVGQKEKEKLLQYLAFLLIILAASPGAAQKGDWGQPPGDHVWTIRNVCFEPIRFAMNYQTVKGRVVTKGWWHVPPQGEAKIRMLSEHIGYYAVSRSNKSHWYDPDGPKFGIDLARDFEYPNDGIQRGVQVYKFRWISVIEEPITRLDCQ